jgi:hypothetical protein
MLVIGHDTAIDFEFEGESFPTEARFRSQLREVVGSELVLADLTSEAGTIVRLSETEIRLIVPGAVSASWRVLNVVGDVIRTDLAPPRHLEFQFTAQFTRPVTRVAP